MAEEWSACPKEVWLRFIRVRSREIMEAHSGLPGPFDLFDVFRITIRSASFGWVLSENIYRLANIVRQRT